MATGSLICLGIVAIVFLSVGGPEFSAWQGSIVCDYYPCDSNKTDYNAGIALSTIGSLAALWWVILFVKYLQRRKSAQGNTSTASNNNNNNNDNNNNSTTPQITQPPATKTKEGAGFCGNCGTSVETPFCTRCGCQV